MSDDTPMPDVNDRLSYFEIRCRSKRGGHISQKEMDFCAHIARTYPEYASQVSAEVFRATAPFGAGI